MQSQQKPVIIVQTTVPVTLKAFFKGQLRWLQDHGFEIHAVSSPGEALGEVGRREGIATHAVPMTRRITPVADLLSLWRLVCLYRRLRPAIVHGFTPKAGLLAMIAASLAGCQAKIYTVFGLPTGMQGFRKRLMLTVDRLSCALADVVFCECGSIREAAIDEGLTAASKLKVLAAWSWNTVGEILGRLDGRHECRGRTRELLRLPPHALVAGFIGRIVPDKGIEELLAAHTALGKEFPELFLMLVGACEAEQPLSPAAVDALRANPKVVRVGVQEDIVPYLAAMDILLHPSYREGLPTVPLEAAAMGLPVVTTRIPGCVDAVVDGVTGILVPPRDSQALTRATRMLLYNPELRRTMGEAGRTWARQNCNIYPAWEELLRQYNELAQIPLRGCNGATCT
jgi:glycosyltransferase involved in cell wall biosynthesis